jgi:hypothetical protein
MSSPDSLVRRSGRHVHGNSIPHHHS